MKDLKRAYRRYKKLVHFKRRAKDVYNKGASYNEKSWAESWEEVKAGEKATWLRTTGRPCDCCMCTEYDKYKRPSKSEMYNLIHHDKNFYLKRY